MAAVKLGAISQAALQGKGKWLLFSLSKIVLSKVLLAIVWKAPQERIQHHDHTAARTQVSHDCCCFLHAGTNRWCASSRNYCRPAVAGDQSGDATHRVVHMHCVPRLCLACALRGLELQGWQDPRVEKCLNLVNMWSCLCHRTRHSTTKQDCSGLMVGLNHSRPCDHVTPSRCACAVFSQQAL
jgi:hypothetical protein